MSPSSLQKIGLIGCGHMGTAMLEGWQAANIAQHYIIIDPQAATLQTRLPITDSLTCFQAIDDAVSSLDALDILVLAVKPQILPSVCEQIKAHIPAHLPLLSIAAGFTLNNFRAFFNAEQPIIRCMPNTPGAIGEGITVLLNTPQISKDLKITAEYLLSVLGDTLWIEEEDQMHAVTAISGSGPAYLFYYIEALEMAALDAGLPKDIAMKLAHKTITGSAQLAAQKDHISPETLRQQVTSPGGTTQAALSKLMDTRLQNLLNEAVNAAIERSRALSNA